MITTETGLIVGRFQPFHKGHKYLMKQALKNEERLVIAIGSATQSHSLKNPFTAGERIEMIDEFKNFDYHDEEWNELLQKDIYPVPIEDKNYNNIWLNHIETMSPDFQTVYTGNQLVKQIFSEDSYNVVEPEMQDRKQYRGKVIREQMKEGSWFKELVPEPVFNYILKINGSERIQTVSTPDY